MTSRMLLLVLLAALFVAAPPAQAAFPGSNGLVAFERKNGAEDFEIFTIAPGGGEGPLTSNATDDRTPSYSPDGTKIAFVRGIGDGRDIWMMDANGANQVSRTTAPGTDLDPTWSPDGTKIAYSRQGAISKDIYVLNADGTGTPQAVTTAAGDETNPAWSPDGSRIAFESPRDGNADIWVKIMAGGSESNLTNTSPGVSSSDPTWSPDGSQIAFTRDAGDTEIYTMDANGGSQTNRTDEATGVPDTAPAFSPDGTRIVWATNRDGNVELWTMASDGNGKGPLTSTYAAESNAPDWQPVNAGGGVADLTRPAISSLAFRYSTFAALGRGGSIARRRVPRGSRVSYRLSEAAFTRLRIERALKGRRKGRRCVAPTRRNRRARRCTRHRLLKGPIAHIGKPGLNRFRFTGRLRGRRLRPGRYRLVMVATDAAGNTSAPKRSRFRIVRR